MALEQKTDQQEHARSDRQKEDKFKAAPTELEETPPRTIMAPSMIARSLAMVKIILAAMVDLQFAR
jgi:hypothetical protein